MAFYAGLIEFITEDKSGFIFKPLVRGLPFPKSALHVLFVEER